MDTLNNVLITIMTHYLAAFAGWVFGYNEGFRHACALTGVPGWIVKNCRKGWRPDGRPGLPENQEVRP